MISASLRLRLGAAVLLLLGLAELLRCLALAVRPGFYPLLAHGALAALALLAGLGLWWRDPRAPAAIVALGSVAAATHLIDGFVLGVRPWLFALATALAAVGGALVLAAWARSEARRFT